MEVTWLRTCYQPSTDAAFSEIEACLNAKGDYSIFNDASLYDFGSNWEKIFLRMPQLLESYQSAEEYEESAKKAIEVGIEAEAEDAEQCEADGYDPEEDGLPWPCFFGDYHMARIMGRIYIVDAKTLASEGRHAGKVLAVWYDECGRVIRSYRHKDVDDAACYGYLDDCYLTEHGCWANAKIGKEYQWGAPFGPPYGESSENEEEDDE